MLAYVRAGLAEIDVYPSSAILRSSATLLLVGGYLFIVGILAQLVQRVGVATNVQLQAFVLLLGMTGLALLLLSDRVRQRTQTFLVRHFRKAQHDSARIWALFSRGLSTVRDEAGLCSVSARLIAETFEVLSVTVWLMDEDREQLIMGASTERHAAGERPDSAPPPMASGAVAAALKGRASPFDLETVREGWAEDLRRLNPTQFEEGGHRWCLPLRAEDKSVGVIVLADRVNGAGYTVEEIELLGCIADQITTILLSLRLTNEVAQARELEAFRTMSAFFVHDLKNAAASLNLMLKNLPHHFDDPAFREDCTPGRR